MKEQLKMKRVETYLMRDEEVADIQLQVDKIVMDNVKRAMKKELDASLGDVTGRESVEQIMAIPKYKLRAFWRKWLGEDK